MFYEFAVLVSAFVVFAQLAAFIVMTIVDFAKGQDVQWVNNSTCVLELLIYFFR